MRLMDWFGTIICLLVHGLESEARPYMPEAILSLTPSTGENVDLEDADIKTFGGNSRGSACEFPFIYKGVRYTECIKLGHRPLKWCATTPNYDEAPTWGYCCLHKACKEDKMNLKRALRVHGRSKAQHILRKLKADLLSVYEDINDWEKQTRSRGEKFGARLVDSASSEEDFVLANRRPENMVRLKDLAEKIIYNEESDKKLESATRSIDKLNSTTERHSNATARWISGDDDAQPTVAGNRSVGEDNIFEEQANHFAQEASQGNLLNTEHAIVDADAADSTQSNINKIGEQYESEPSDSAFKKNAPRTKEISLRQETQTWSKISKEDEVQNIASLTGKTSSTFTSENASAFKNATNSERKQNAPAEINAYIEESEDDTEKNKDVFSAYSNATSGDLLASQTGDRSEMAADNHPHNTGLKETGFKEEESEKAIQILSYRSKVQTVGGNANGAPCEFPFVYDGITRDQCILENREKEWCSTTSNYDKSPRWGYCCQGDSCERLERDLDIQHQKELSKIREQEEEDIVTYKGQVTLAKVLKQTEKDAENSSLPGASDKQEIIIRTVGGNGEGKPCVFPFVGDGESHYTCIPNYEGKMWCSVTGNFDTHPYYGFCCDDQGTYGANCDKHSHKVSLA